jgi:hypothetical protein
MMMVGGMKVVEGRYANGFQLKFMVEVIECFFGICFKIPECVIEVKKNVLIFHVAAWGIKYSDANIL